jgi:hypothetical protein
MDGPLTLTAIRAAIRRFSFHNADEFELHAGLEKVLAGLGLTVEREVRLDEKNRIDIAATQPGWLRLGVEVKVAGRGPDVLRQVRRYTSSPELDAVMLVTTISRHMTSIMPWVTVPDGPPGVSRWTLDDKPFDVVTIRRGLM